MRLVRLLVALFVLSFSARAIAQVPGDAPPLAKDLGALVAWLSTKSPPKCTEKCFVLTKLELEGSVGSSGISFALEGAVLADHAVAVPLFGPPNKVRLEKVTENGKPAAVGFEGDHYFVVTSSKRFTLEGTLALDGDLALTIPGPLNTLEASFTSGRVVEGARLAGLSGATIHFDTGEPAKTSAEPTVFQLSRAFRVLRETAFEYRLVLRSGADLGVVRLPLSYGEKVLEVNGSTGWKVEGTELVLPTAGRNATITITGSMASPPKALAPDGRSAYEWWLLESDAEHRITATGTATQLDSADSPIPRSQPTSRLFLAKRGETLSLAVQSLSSVEALAAVVRDHTRTVVLTARGDLVFDELLLYENNGVDYLALAPSGRPIFLSTDGRAERLMYKEGDLGKLMIALHKGAHAVRVQSVGEPQIARLFGVLALPTSQHGLTASRSVAHIGLPANVHPIVALGGDRLVWLVEDAHFVAMAVAVLFAWIAMSRVRDRLLLAVVLGGAWFVFRPAFVGIVAAAALVATFRILSRRLEGRALLLGRVAAVAVALGVFAYAAGRTAVPPRALDEQAADVTARTAEVTAEARKNDANVSTPSGAIATGNWAANESGGVLAGVTPVALPLPSVHRWVTVSRELVTNDRPFVPRVVYVTTLALVPFAAVWLLAFGLLAWSHRAAIALRLAALRSLFAPKPPAEAGAAAE